MGARGLYGPYPIDDGRGHMPTTTRADGTFDPARRDSPPQLGEDSATESLSQEETDARRQSDLTRSVGVTLTRPDNRVTGLLSALKRFGRNGGRGVESAAPGDSASGHSRERRS
jgi:hypothetical protein